MTEPVVVIREERQKAVLRRHPWIFSGAVKTVTGNPADGDLVTVRSERGEFLARGYWNSQSSICVRLLSWDEAQPIDEAFWRERLRRAIAARQPQNRIAAQGTPAAYRLVNAENDGLPGLVVDRYGEWLVIQALTLGIEVRKAMLADLLGDLLRPAGIYERSDVDVRAKEGLALSTGSLAGSPPPETIEIDENGRHFLVDVRAGHKTGFYLDQRENREIIGDWFRWDEQAAEREVLNAFAYTGGFA
ncbi:MAG: class I SAM-dependent methyltransferase, partial [Chloroflexota bacterium]